MGEARILDQPAALLGDEILARSPEGRFPLAGQWELTCRCNLKCVMCYTDCFNTSERIPQELSTTEILRILQEIHEAGCLELTFTGGEPLSRPDFMEIYESAHDLGFLVTIFSNGTLITPEIANRWTEKRPHKVEISLHGISATVFERVTQIPVSFERCLHAIRLLQERRIPVTLKTVGMTINQEEILAIKQFANNLGPDVSYKFGQYMRDDLAQSGSPYQYQLPEAMLQDIERQDPQLWAAKEKDLTP